MAQPRRGEAADAGSLRSLNPLLAVAGKTKRKTNMLLVELKPLVGRLNGFCKQALEDGVGVCVSRGHYEITVEHLLVKLFDDQQADIALLLRQQDVEAAQVKRAINLSLEQMKTGNA